MPSVATADTLSSTGVMLATGTVDMSKKSLEGLRVYWCNALSSTGTDTYCKLPMILWILCIRFKYTLQTISYPQSHFDATSLLCETICIM